MALFIFSAIIVFLIFLYPKRKIQLLPLISFQQFLGHIRLWDQTKALLLLRFLFYSRTMKNNRNTWRPFERWSLFSSGSTSDDECCHSSLEKQLQSHWHYLAWCPVGLSSHSCCVSVHWKGTTMLWVMAMLWSQWPVLPHLNDSECCWPWNCWSVLCGKAV